VQCGSFSSASCITTYYARFPVAERTRILRFTPPINASLGVPCFLDAGESRRVYWFAVLAHLPVFPALVLLPVLGGIYLYGASWAPWLGTSLLS